ncbi:MAG: SDR family oxidoreductase [Flavobacteriaceae bacterium]|nr:SDR family oxidoreductase [Flavobacteriaceae bacterium]NVJ72296.1 SDR family oxidoreductase [Flavobacteriaceae bacterium]
MKILLTGANGYIGKRLLTVLLGLQYEVICCVRDKKRFHFETVELQRIQVIEIDLLDKESLNKLPKDIDGAYYLVHSMSNSENFNELEEKCALNFQKYLEKTSLQHLIYLGGIVNSTVLSKHLNSRKNVEQLLSKGSYNFTSLRAGIIIGSGSASFEIIRDLVEKLPIMITPNWLLTKCQPIGISDVLIYLSRCLFNKATYQNFYDIGGPDILSYKEMLEGYAASRNLKRVIYTVPVMTPRLSSYWLYFVTSTTYRLAVSLVDSMHVEVTCSENNLNELLDISPISYQEALEKAFNKIGSKNVISSWKDSYTSSGFKYPISDLLKVPEFGCFVDQRSMHISNLENTIDKIWKIGGATGWYQGNFLWEIRGFIDKLSGGVGLRRGRTNSNTINAGDAIDFWRVLYANKNKGHLLLFAEMKLPGEAWLEFKIIDAKLVQTATFRPLGVYGRLYWYAVLPFHSYIFEGMLRKLIN